MVDSPARSASTAERSSVDKRPIRPKVVNLNLIPIEFRRPLVTRPRLFMLTVILTAGIAFPRVYAAQIEVGSKAGDLRQQLAALSATREAEIKRVAAQETQATQLNEQIARLRQQATQQTTRSSAETQTVRAVALAPGLQLVLAGDAEGLEVTAVTWREPTLTVEGRAATLSTLMSYTRKLQESGFFSKLRVRLLDDMAEQAKPGTKPGAQAITGALGALPALTPSPASSVSNARRGLGFGIEIEFATDGGS